MAAKLVIEPIFEADFQPCSYGCRPKKSATQALEAIREAGNRGHNFVVDADIRGYFDGIDRNTLMELVKERISGRRVMKLIRQWLEAGVMEDGTVRETLADSAGRSDLAVAGQHLPEQAGSDPGGTLFVARNTGPVRRRFRGDVPNGVAG